MEALSRLERLSALDHVVRPLQRLARLVPGPLRDPMHGVWLGHPVHPLLVQVPIGSWLSATALGFSSGNDAAARRLTALGLASALPAAMTGAVDWAEQHEQQLRVGVVHAAANWLAMACFAGSLARLGSRRTQLLRLCGLTAIGVSGALGGHLSFRLAGGVNHAEAVPHLISPGWHHLLPERELPEGAPVRCMIGEVPVVAVRYRGQVHVLANRCSHMSGPLSDGEISDGTITCPWHGSRFCLTDGSVAAGPATAPQPSFETRVTDGAIEVRLPGAG
jgi:nitrite reductase/ring-hydroxylating ferredoxin subunit